ncbi:MAG: hypothetical protein JWP34_5094 [Massilia sp.]|nr:hypothetical protein [Massilia sp.]
MEDALCGGTVRVGGSPMASVGGRRRVWLLDAVSVWDDWTVMTTAMLIGAARAAGPDEAAL